MAAILVVEFGYGIYTGRNFEFARPVAEPVIEGNSQWVGTVLYQNYLLPFEIASILLLVAIIGAVVLSKKPPSEEQAEPAAGD